MKIAVYGTLRRKGGNGPLISDGKYLGSFRSDPIYQMRSLADNSYPGIKEGGDISVLFEVYDLTKKQIEEVDRLEGYIRKDNVANLYERKIIRTPYGRAFAYYYNREFKNEQKTINLGDWIAFTKSLRLISC